MRTETCDIPHIVETNLLSHEYKLQTLLTAGQKEKYSEI